LVRVDNLTTELVAGIPASTLNLAMQAFGLPPMAASLQLRKLALRLPIELAGFQALAIAGYRYRLDPQVNPNRFSWCNA
jgi:hypothetical protein